MVVPTFCNVLGTVREYCPFSQNTAEDKHELAYSLGNGSLFLLYSLWIFYYISTPSSFLAASTHHGCLHSRPRLGSEVMPQYRFNSCLQHKNCCIVKSVWMTYTKNLLCAKIVQDVSPEVTQPETQPLDSACPQLGNKPVKQDSCELYWAEPALITQSNYLCPEERGYRRLPRGADGKAVSQRRTISYQREGGVEARLWGVAEARARWMQFEATGSNMWHGECQKRRLKLCDQTGIKM